MQYLLEDIPMPELELIGMVSASKSHKMAWLLNHLFGWQLAKQPDKQMLFVKERYLRIVNYLYLTPHNSIRLIKNRSPYAKGVNKPFLLPELAAFDFFICIDNQTGTVPASKFLAEVKELDQVQLAQTLTLADLKNGENLIF